MRVRWSGPQSDVLLIIALSPSPFFFCISQSFHPGRLNSDPTFSLKPPLTRAGQRWKSLLWSTSTRLACTDQSTQGCGLVMLSLRFSGPFKRNIDHSLFLCVCAVSPAGFDRHSPSIWFVLKVSTSDPGRRQMPEELPGPESFVLINAPLEMQREVRLLASSRFVPVQPGEMS